MSTRSPTHDELVRRAIGDRTVQQFADASRGRFSRRTVYDWLQQGRVPEYQRAAVAAASQGRVKASDFAPVFKPRKRRQ